MGKKNKCRDISSASLERELSKRRARACIASIETNSVIGKMKDDLEQVLKIVKSGREGLDSSILHATHCSAKMTELLIVSFLVGGFVVYLVLIGVVP